MKIKETEQGYELQLSENEYHVIHASMGHWDFEIHSDLDRQAYEERATIDFNTMRSVKEVFSEAYRSCFNVDWDDPEHPYTAPRPKDLATANSVISITMQEDGLCIQASELGLDVFKQALEETLYSLDKWEFSTLTGYSINEMQEVLVDFIAVCKQLGSQRSQRTVL